MWYTKQLRIYFQLWKNPKACIISKSRQLCKIVIISEWSVVSDKKEYLIICQILWNYCRQNKRNDEGKEKSLRQLYCGVGKFHIKENTQRFSENIEKTCHVIVMCHMGVIANSWRLKCQLICNTFRSSKTM